MSEYAVDGVCIETEANHDSGAGAAPSEGRAEYSNRLVKRRRHPGKVATRRYAIQNFCRGGVGFNSDGLGSITENVRQCPATECWLWPWRAGSIDPEAWER